MPQASQVNPSVIDTLHAAGERPAVVYRYAGDRFLLLEYGEMVLDLTMNFRIFGLNEAIKRADIDGVIETVPALRSIDRKSTRLNSSHVKISYAVFCLKKKKKKNKNEK